jgi:hypothetical protein
MFITSPRTGAARWSVRSDYNLIARTTTRTGLRIRAELDSQYPIGLKVSTATPWLNLK